MLRRRVIRRNPAKNMEQKELQEKEMFKSELEDRIRKGIQGFSEQDFSEFEPLRKYDGFVVLGNAPHEQKDYPDNFCVVRMNNYVLMSPRKTDVHFIGSSNSQKFLPCNEFLPEINNSEILVFAKDLEKRLCESLKEKGVKIQKPVIFYSKKSIMDFLESVFEVKNKRKLWISGLHSLVLFYALSKHFNKVFLFDGFSENKTVNGKCKYYYGEKELNSFHRYRHTQGHDWDAQMKFVEFLRKENDQN